MDIEVGTSCRGTEGLCAYHLTTCWKLSERMSLSQLLIQRYFLCYLPSFWVFLLCGQKQGQKLKDANKGEMAEHRVWRGIRWLCFIWGKSGVSGSLRRKRDPLRNEEIPWKILFASLVLATRAGLHYLPPSPSNKSLSSMGGGLGLRKSFWKGGGIEVLKEISEVRALTRDSQSLWLLIKLSQTGKNSASL